MKSQIRILAFVVLSAVASSSCSMLAGLMGLGGDELGLSGVDQAVNKSGYVAASSAQASVDGGNLYGLFKER